MIDNKRLQLDTTVPGESTVPSVTDNPQAIPVVLPDQAELTSNDEVLVIGGILVSNTLGLPSAGEALLIPCVIDPVSILAESATDALRLASIRTMLTAVEMQKELPVALTANVRMGDEYETIVDLFGNQQPGVYYLLREGGNGFVTYENGNRILIL
jgi:hypothetical protein